MANVLGNYNPIFYANEALIHLRKVLGLANRVHRGYELERRAVNKGEVISIRKPSTFTAQDPITAAQDLNTQTVNILLDQNPGVAYTLTDVELAYTGEQIIQEHIEPAAYAIADHIDRSLAAEFKNVPWLYDYGTAADHQVITGALAVMFANGVPMNDGNLHMMVDGTLQMGFQNSAIFHNAGTTGDGQNPVLFRGGLGTRFGVEVFANQNAPTHTPGTAAGGGDTAGAVDDNPLEAGATSMTITGLTNPQTVVAGDTFLIAGNTQRYAVVTGGTVAAGTTVTVTFTPPAVQDYAQGSVVTLGAQTSTAHTQQMLFHRNAFALAMAPLPNRLPGIEVSVATDPVTGISLRARRWSTGIPAATYVAIDCLYGTKTLDPNLAVRAWT